MGEIAASSNWPVVNRQNSDVGQTKVEKPLGRWKRTINYHTGDGASVLGPMLALTSASPDGAIWFLLWLLSWAVAGKLFRVLDRRRGGGRLGLFGVLLVKWFLGFATVGAILTEMEIEKNPELLVFIFGDSPDEDDKEGPH